MPEPLTPAGAHPENNDVSKNAPEIDTPATSVDAGMSPVDAALIVTETRREDQDSALFCQAMRVLDDSPATCCSEILAAEVRRLREENAALKFSGEALVESLKKHAVETDRLRALEQHVFDSGTTATYPADRHDGYRDWWAGGEWLHPGEKLIVLVLPENFEVRNPGAGKGAV